MVFDIAEKPQNFTGLLWLVVVGISILLYFLGVFFEVRGLRCSILILGIFVALPGLIFCTVPLFLFMELAKIRSEIKISILFSYTFLLCAWCLFQARKIIYLEGKHEYLKKNVRVRGAIGFFYPYSAGMLCEEGGGKSVGKRRILPIIVPIIFFGYPAQRLIADVGGSVGFFGVIAVLTIPMALYLAGKISAGYFLWVYLVGNFEKKSSIKIFLRYRFAFLCE
ncbi:hypothetical protein [Duganella sp. CF517]|uniref:hypothetical protein n=1 Tax=Duganella sp. CF517 TaxID=1881038 RepID=UPI0015A54AA9|nr:hypothetical protein [Duganella sp. CF517]